MLSVLILFVCVILMFTKFAIFVLGTIILSTIYSLLFFSACCLVMGPSGDFGSITILFRLCGRCFGCKRTQKPKEKK